MSVNKNSLLTHTIILDVEDIITLVYGYNDDSNLLINKLRYTKDFKYAIYNILTRDIGISVIMLDSILDGQTRTVTTNTIHDYLWGNFYTAFIPIERSVKDLDTVSLEVLLINSNLQIILTYVKKPIRRK